MCSHDNDDQVEPQCCPFCNELVESKFDHSDTCENFQNLADLFEIKLLEAIQRKTIG